MKYSSTRYLGARLSMAKIGNATAKSSSTNIFPESTKNTMMLLTLWTPTSHWCYFIDKVFIALFL